MPEKDKVSSAYLHIPFCQSICSYCGFCKMFYHEDMVNRYLECLEKEVRDTYQQEELDTIYVGGGTPSCLNLNQLEKLFQIISLFKVSHHLEYTIECNFDSMTEEKLKLCKKYGVNRLSFGLESVSPKNLQLLERSENKEVARTIISLAKNLGFDNINVDLMYAISSDRKALENDIDFILSLDVPHISCYSLMIEENTKLYLKKIPYIDEEIDFFMYNDICNKLRKKYRHYEVSNFAKEGYESRHNLVYWNNLPYYGFGLSASGYLGNNRYTNTKSISSYLKGNTIYEEEYLNKDIQMSYEMILGLRKLEGVRKSDFYERYHQEIEEVFDISSLIEKGLLLDNDGYYKISEKNIYISNEILVYFLKE